MTYQFQLLQTTRENIFKLLDGLGIRQLNYIPEGFSNNLLWNAGHVLATQQKLLYGLSGQELLLSDIFIETFRKGTRPEGEYDAQMAEFIKEKLVPTAQQAAMDYERGVFQTFTPYQTSYGIELKDFGQALQFNNVHESLHLGYMMALKKRLG
ncbi:MAG: DinB family protein [Phaeodactylibacter sp.]|nr:DinB family protein [Phaeodactylibacter sp.]MCB9299459.1 DinB family protein [Lewinellaceae bacterium]HQU60309.1 DinB family protein [Saprospiraceae bacterium]